MMPAKNYHSQAGLYATLLAYGTFAFATLIVVLRLLLPENKNLVSATAYFTLMAASANTVLLLWLCYYCVARQAYRSYYAHKIFLLLCNIPVAGLYTYIAF